MNKLVLTYFALMISAATFAQNVITMYSRGDVPYTFFFDDNKYEADSLDAIQMRICYNYAFVSDTVSNEVEKDRSVLDIGSNHSRYYHYLYCETDSLILSGAIKRPKNNRNIEKSAPFPISFYEMVYQDRNIRKLTCTGRVVTQDFLYVEDMPDIHWEISDSTSTICGYTVISATCNFRGRDYVAWFTPDIPVSLGPWKFSGLPGLILKITDTRGFYSFEAEKVYAVPGIIEMPKYLYSKYKNNSRYLKAKTLYYTDRGLAQSIYAVNTSWQVTPARKRTIKVLGNDFIEKLQK